MTLDIKKPQSKSTAVIEDIPSRMNACLFYGPKDIRYENIATPTVGDSDILVKVDTALTCGSDLKTFRQGHPKLISSSPSLFGHQFSGTVAKAGKNIDKFHIGQRVVSANTAPCFSCVYCIRQEYSLCKNLEYVNGAFAEYILVPERNVRHNTYEIPENVSFEIAADLESLAVVLHGFDRSEITKGKTVCVLGSGAIGLMFVALAKLAGAKTISIGRRDFKLQVAREFGADHTINSTLVSLDKLVSEVRGLTGGDGADVVIEAVGTQETWELAAMLATRGGLVNFFGGCKKGSKVELDTYRLHYDELKLIGVFHHTPAYVKKAFDLMRRQVIPSKFFAKIITHTFPLVDLEKAFLLHESGEAIQVAVKP